MESGDRAKATDKLSVIGAKEGFADTGVFSGVETSTGNLLLGGRESVTEYDGRSFRIVKGIDLAENMSLGRDGLIWTASGSGVHRYGQGRWITNAIEEGLISAAVHGVYSDFEGGVWAGTSRGISLYYPSDDTHPPVTSIVDDRNLRQTPPGGEVRLAFSGIDKWKFTSPDRLTFSWRLDNSAWSDFDPLQFASFTKLRSGGHQFDVRAMDRNGNVDPNPASFQFTVLTPLVQRPRVLCGGRAGSVRAALIAPHGSEVSRKSEVSEPARPIDPTSQPFGI